jgi:hypothetical protein
MGKLFLQGHILGTFGDAIRVHVDNMHSLPFFKGWFQIFLNYVVTFGYINHIMAHSHLMLSYH